MQGTSARHGECNSCGWCCQFNGVHRNVVDAREADVEFYRLRGAQPVQGQLLYLAHEYLPCSAHDKAGAKCAVYDARPETCRSFPEVPGQIEGTPCSFWFEETADDGTISRRGGSGSPHASPPRFHLKVVA